jgi:hypothetical protein
MSVSRLIDCRSPKGRVDPLKKRIFFGVDSFELLSMLVAISLLMMADSYRPFLLFVNEKATPALKIV